MNADELRGNSRYENSCRIVRSHRNVQVEIKQERQLNPTKYKSVSPPFASISVH